MKTFRVLACNATLVLLCSVSAVAQKDNLVATPTSPSLGAVTGGSTVQTTVNYAVDVPKNACNGNACTTYSRTVNFTLSDPMAAIASGNPCTLSGRTSTCAVVVNITAPAADSVQDKGYSVTLSGADSHPGNSAIEMVPLGGVIISFTVPKAAAAPMRTKLDLNDACGVLRGTDVLLQALLMTDPDAPGVSAPVVGHTIEFSFNGTQWTATTDANGLAGISVPLTGLNVGDYLINAVFAGTSSYIGSNDAAWLGVKVYVPRLHAADEC